MTLDELPPETLKIIVRYQAKVIEVLVDAARAAVRKEPGGEGKLKTALGYFDLSEELIRAHAGPLPPDA